MSSGLKEPFLESHLLEIFENCYSAHIESVRGPNLIESQLTHKYDMSKQNQVKTAVSDEKRPPFEA